MPNALEQSVLQKCRARLHTAQAVAHISRVMAGTWIEGVLCAVGRMGSSLFYRPVAGWRSKVVPDAHRAF